MNAVPILVAIQGGPSKERTRNRETTVKQRYMAILFSTLALTWACTPGGDTATDDTSDTETVAQAEAASPLIQRAQALFEVVPDMPPELEDNPITPVKVELGKKLYFEPRLSQSWLISCNTCHNLGLGGVDLMETSIGHGWQAGPRNAPTVLNSVYNLAQFWDGRAADLMEQAQGPVQAAVEMSSTPERTVETLKSIPEYVMMFGEVFPDEADPVTFENMARAIEAFEATLITPNSPFDKYLGGDDAALTDAAKSGLALFMDSGCTACHGGILLGGSSYQRFGAVRNPGAELLPPEDRGRFNVTGDPNDEYAFKVPVLRNVELTAPYFHTGKLWSLSESVGVMGEAQLGKEFTEEELTRITTFLGTLTGDQPTVEYPVLPVHTAATPPPDPWVGLGAGTH
jgi:cytochrome c peroxidase